MGDRCVGAVRRAFGAAAVLAVAVLGSGRASAQPYNGGAGGGSPGASPYLNLLRGSNPAYLNYYGLVRPEQQSRAQGTQLQQQQSQLGTVSNSVMSLQQASRGGADLQTGHSFGFQTQRQYFMTTNGTGVNRGGGMGVGGGGQGVGGQGVGGGGMGSGQATSPGRGRR